MTFEQFQDAIKARNQWLRDGETKTVSAEGILAMMKQAYEKGFEHGKEVGASFASKVGSNWPFPF